MFFFFFFHCSIIGKNRDFLIKIGPKKKLFSRSAKIVLGVRGWRGGGGVKVGRYGYSKQLFYGRPNGCSVRIKIPSLGIIRIAFAPIGYANVSASIVSLKRLIVSKTFLDTFNTFEPHDKTNKMVCAPSEDRSAWASALSDQSLRCPHEESLVT